MTQVSLFARQVYCVLVLTVLLLAGCGDSSEDFVATGNNQPGGGTLTFQFVRAQAATVPTGTASLRFDYLSSTNAELDSETLAFATSITVAPPDGTTAVEITGLDANGFPLLSLTGAVPAPNGQNLTVDMTAFTNVIITYDALSVSPATAAINIGQTEQLALAASFSNGETVSFSAALLSQAIYQSDTPGVASVSTSGLVSGLATGTANVTATFTDGSGQAQSDSAAFTVGSGQVDVLTIAPSVVDLAPGATQAYTATFTPAGGTASDVTATTTFNSDIADVTFNGPTATVSDQASTGTGTVTATFVDSDGDTNTATATVNVIPLEVIATRFAAPGADLELPDASFTYQVALEQELNNGTTVPVGVDAFNFVSSDAAIAAINADSGLITTNNTNSAGTTTISLREDGSNAVLDTFILTVSDTTVTGISVNPGSFDLPVNQPQSYTVLASYANGSTGVDVTHSPLVMISNAGPGSANALFSQGQALGLNIGNPTNYEFSLNGQTDSVEVRVALGFVTSLTPTVGGLTSGLIPEDFDGVVGARATLTDGSTVQLLMTDLMVANPGGSVFDQSGPFGNVLTPTGGNTNLGDTDDITLTLMPVLGRYQYADPMATPTEFTVTVVSKASPTAEFRFRHNPDDLVLLAFVPREIVISFSNDAVSDFELSFANVAQAGPGINATLIPGLNGFTGIQPTGASSVAPSETIIVLDSAMNNQTVVTLPSLLCYQNLTTMADPVPGAAVIPVGGVAEFRAIYTGFNSPIGMPGGAAETFDITDELFFESPGQLAQVLQQEPGEPVRVLGTTAGPAALFGRDHVTSGFVLSFPANLTVTP